MARIRYLKAKQPDKRHWRRWMQRLGVVREIYYRRAGHDPFEFGEQTVVGLMLSAAGQAHLTGTLEYATRKRRPDLRGDCYGRCDLWLMASRDSDTLGWAFEIKHARITSASSRARLVGIFRSAWRDAGALLASEASKRIACTVFYCGSDIAADGACARTLDWLASQSDWAWRIDHSEDLATAYVFMKHRQRANRCRA